MPSTGESRRAASAIARFICGLFYRLTVSGPPVERSGPALLLANHPNSLLDPLLVTAAAGRRVRFLAAAKLFKAPLARRVLTAAGAIPVYRRMDDPSQVEKNAETFRAAYEILAGGGAVGLFPEGISHHEPAMVPLRTGAARIALGAAQRTGEFPIVPAGLVFQQKERFRSRAHVAIGRPISWSDLAGSDPEDRNAVAELTRRIDDALHGITVNYQQWEDAPLVELATRIYTVELGVAAAERHVEIRARAAGILATLRRNGDPEAAALARELQRHGRLLRVLGITPGDVHRGTGLLTAAGWLARRILPALLFGPVVLAAVIVFWAPYRLTRAIAERYATGPANLSTCKLFFGLGVFALWIAALVAIIALVAGVAAGALALLLLPALVIEALGYLAPWYGAIREARSYMTLRTRAERIRELRVRQRELALRLKALRDRVLVEEPLPVHA